MRCGLGGWNSGRSALTLQSLSEDSFDGLNNILQIPFALPWFLLPLPGVFDRSHETDVWATAIMGRANAVLLYALLVRRVRPRTMVDSRRLRTAVVA